MITIKHIFCTAETPKGSNAKYNYDPNCGGFVLAKYLPLGFVFPYDFGFIPGTEGEDGDPLDVIIIAEQGTFPGCMMKCRVIGAIKAVQQENGEMVENDRFLVVPETSMTFGSIHRVAQLPDTVLEELQNFFISYNKQEDKLFRPLKIMSAKDALNAIEIAKKKMKPAKKIEIFVPLTDRKGKPFPNYLYKNIKKQLIKDFGGMTAYIQAPAEGIWADEGHEVVKDRMIVYEVMVPVVDQSYWREYKQKLEYQFAQKELVIRQSDITVF
nr:inorganic diphosphatase [uncultured Sphingobacterium sp.]